MFCPLRRKVTPEDIRRFLEADEEILKAWDMWEWMDGQEPDWENRREREESEGKETEAFHRPTAPPSDSSRDTVER